MTELEKYEAIIIDSGSKLTKQRKQILNIIMEHSTSHFSADALYDVAKRIDDSIGIATIYRTLELFESLKIIRNVKLRNDGIKYYDLVDLDEKNHFHHHLICQKCKDILEIADDLDSYEAFVKEKYGFTVTDHDLLFYGICQSCQNKE